MNTEDNVGFESIDRPTWISAAWGWDNDRAHKPAHYEVIWRDFQAAAKQFAVTNLIAQKVDSDGFQILHYNTQTQQLYGTVRKWIWDECSMKRQLLDLVFTKSRTELVIEYRGNNRPGTVIYRLHYQPADLRILEPKWDCGGTNWIMVQDTTARPYSVHAFPLEGKHFTKWLHRNIAGMRGRLSKKSFENMAWLLGTLEAWQVVDVIEGDNIQHLRKVAATYNTVVYELAGIADRHLPQESTGRLDADTVTNFLTSLSPLTKPGTPSLGLVWAGKIFGNKTLQVTLDPDDPNPIETVNFLLEEFRKGAHPFPNPRFEGTKMKVEPRSPE